MTFTLEQDKVILQIFEKYDKESNRRQLDIEKEFLKITKRKLAFKTILNRYKSIRPGFIIYFLKLLK